MHHVGEFAEGGIFAHQDTNLLYYVCGMGTVGMTAEERPTPSPSLRGRGITILYRRSEKLQHTLCLIHRQGLAIGTPEGFLTDVGDALRLQLVFCRTDAGSLRLSEDGGWHDVETNTILLAKNLVYSADGLHLGSMSQHLTAIDIADGVNMI